MKKRIFKQMKMKNQYQMDHRKVIYRNTRHRAGKAAMALALFCLLAGAARPAYGREAEDLVTVRQQAAEDAKEASGTVPAAPKVVVTEIFHRHMGDASREGGCYKLPVPHVHEGDEINGGACFQEEVKHVHEGDEASGTGCYTRPILHTHDGNEGQEGACYHAVYHTHEDGCYQNEICTIKFEREDVFETITAKCPTHGETTFNRANGTGTHENCDKGKEAVILEDCQLCELTTYNYHTYPVVVCGTGTDQIIGYEKICGKEEGDIEGYETGCNRTEGQTESYRRTCEKTVEGYERNCGLDEKIPCGRLTVTNETAGQEELVTVSVKFEDLSGGKLILSQDPFRWYDETGKEIGSADRIEVGENGNYTVELKLENRDVDEDGLRSSMLVDNVLGKSSGGEEISPSPSASPSPGKEEPSPEQTPGNGDGDNGGGDNGDGDGNDGGGDPVPAPLAAPTPVVIHNGEEGNQEDNGEDSFVRNQNDTLPQKDGEDLEPSASPSPALVMKKETTKRKPEEKMESAPSVPEKKEISRLKGFFSIPAVRVITVAAGTLLLLTGLFLLLLYLRKSVRLYNDDGEGGFIYLGRLAVRLEEDGYGVTIPEKAMEKAYTNRYCIRPGIFRFGKGEQTLFVYQDEKKVSACLSKEIIVVF